MKPAGGTSIDFQVTCRITRPKSSFSRLQLVLSITCILEQHQNTGEGLCESVLWLHAARLFPFTNLHQRDKQWACPLSLCMGGSQSRFSYYWLVLSNAYLRFLHFNLLCNGYSSFPQPAALLSATLPCYHSKYVHASIIRYKHAADWGEQNILELIHLHKKYGLQLEKKICNPYSDSQRVKCC